MPLTRTHWPRLIACWRNTAAKEEEEEEEQAGQARHAAAAGAGVREHPMEAAAMTAHPPRLNGQ